MRSLRGFLTLVVAAIAALLMPIATTASGSPADVAPVSYGYAHYNAAQSTSSAIERGPPEDHPRSNTYNANGQQPLGAPTRSDGMPTPATYSYDDTQHLVRIARRSHVFEGPGSGGQAEPAGLSASSVAANTARLESRITEVHGALDPIAQTRRTTAALGTREGTTVLGGGVRDLSPAQRALLEEGEMMAGGPGHAEATTVLGARGAGLTPQEIVTSWDICPACQIFLRNEGATLTGPRSAKW
jgi:hypothetical protein